MKLTYDRKSSDPTYYIQQSVRFGNKVTTKSVKRIGKHSELLKITDDPLAYAKEQVALCNEEYKSGRSSGQFTVDFNQLLANSDSVTSFSTDLNVGYFFLQKIYQDLKLNEFFKDITADSKITFDPDLVNRFLTYARILFPDSKLGTFENLSRFYEKPDFHYEHILRTMDLLSDHYDDYIAHLFKNSNKIIKRDTSVCYFDCTNYYFEIEEQDEDYIDEVTGEFIKGFRKYGPSKEHRPNPIVQMGLFMDSDGIPLSMCINPGSDNEQNCVIPEEEKLIKMLDGKKLIYCADAGLNSIAVRNFNSMGGRAFVVTQSVKMLSDELKQIIFEDKDYRLVSDGSPFSLADMRSFDKMDKNNYDLYNDSIYKIIEADRAVDVGLYETKYLKNGKTKKSSPMPPFVRRSSLLFPER